MNSDDVALSKKRWEGIYKKTLLDDRQDFHTDPTIRSYKKFLDGYKKYYQHGTFLDLGCGIAWTSAVLAKKGIHTVGIDISSEAIQKSKEIFKKHKLKGRFIQADLLALPLQDASVDFIYSCMSIEYVRDTQKAVEETYRVLKPKGVMVAIVPVVSLTTLTYHQLRGDIPQIPIIKSFMEWVHVKVLKGKYMQYGYEKSFTPFYLRSLFLRAGFQVKKIDYFDMHYPITFVPQIIRPFAQRLLKYRPFWPLVYIEAMK